MYSLGIGHFIVSPVLPQIAKDLNIPGSQFTWIITLYTLVYVIAVPLMSSVQIDMQEKN
ncbi:MAG: hypothetical protein R2771_08230 [Saprospiraceae bacterium]